MVAGWILVYGMPAGASAGDMNRVRRALFGYADRSNAGRYEYERPGALTGVPHRVLRTGTLLLPLDQGEAAAAVVKKHGGWTWLRKVELTPSEAKTLYPVADSTPV